MQSWKTIPFSLLHRVGGPLLFECNFSLKTLPELPDLPLFYHNVLNAWEGIVRHTPTTGKEIENEILWNNHLITIGGKSVFYKKWYDAGVKTLADILDDEGKFLSFAEFTKKYKIKTNFLCYIGLCNAIPKYWREAFNCDPENELVCTEQSTQPTVNSSFWTCQQARLFYVSKAFQKPTAESRLIKAGFSNQNISAVYLLPFKVTKNIKLSMFQFKINHHILYTRDKLFRAKITDDDECQLCGTRQTLQHLLAECQHVQIFWNLFTSWWNSCNSPKVALTNKDKIYAYHPKERSFHVLNFCLIVARYYIYTAAKESESFSLLAFKIVLKNKLSTEPSGVRASVNF
ncbi:uncharacterized protein LOC144651783 [Oculina patagonica]